MKGKRVATDRKSMGRKVLSKRLFHLDSNVDKRVQEVTDRVIDYLHDSGKKKLKLPVNEKELEKLIVKSGSSHLVPKKRVKIREHSEVQTSFQSMDDRVSELQRKSTSKSSRVTPQLNRKNRPFGNLKDCNFIQSEREESCDYRAEELIVVSRSKDKREDISYHKARRKEKRNSRDEEMNTSSKVILSNTEPSSKSEVEKRGKISIATKKAIDMDLYHDLSNTDIEAPSNVVLEQQSRIDFEKLYLEDWINKYQRPHPSQSAKQASSTEVMQLYLFQRSGNAELLDKLLHFESSRRRSLSNILGNVILDLRRVA